MRPLQYFSDDYLEQSRKIPPQQILQFLEDFRLMHAPRGASRLISMKVHESLLDAFKLRCRVDGVRYQTKIKELMHEWLSKGPA